jgi:hypothetical protein
MPEAAPAGAMTAAVQSVHEIGPAVAAPAANRTIAALEKNVITTRRIVASAFKLSPVTSASNAQAKERCSRGHRELRESSREFGFFSICRGGAAIRAIERFVRQTDSSAAA